MNWTVEFIDEAKKLKKPQNVRQNIVFDNNKNRPIKGTYPSIRRFATILYFFYTQKERSA